MAYSNANKKSNSQTETKRTLFLTADEQRHCRLEAMKRSPGKAKSLWLQRNLPKRSTPQKRTPKKLGTPRKCTTPRKDGTPRKQITPRKSDNYKNLNENGKRSRSEMESKDEPGTKPADLSDTQRRVSSSRMVCALILPQHM